VPKDGYGSYKDTKSTKVTRSAEAEPEAAVPVERESNVEAYENYGNYGNYVK
jgi:hypothetical protein